MLEEAFAIAEASLQADAAGHCCFSPPKAGTRGLLGLIAGRVAERFRLPTFVSALEPDGFATGSARSIATVDLGAVVRAAVHEGLLVKGGGHAMAAGFRLERLRQNALLEFLSARLAAPVTAATCVRHLAIDGALSAGGANQDLMALLDRAGPLWDRPSRAALRVAGASPGARATHQGRAYSLHACRRPTVRASKRARFAWPTRRSARFCYKGKGCRFTSPAACAAPAGRAATASSCWSRTRPIRAPPSRSARCLRRPGNLSI